MSLPPSPVSVARAAAVVGALCFISSPSGALAQQQYPQYPQYQQPYPQQYPQQQVAPYEAPRPESSPAGAEGGGMQSPGLFGAGLFFGALGVGGLAAGGYFYSAGSGACDGISMSSIPSAAQVDTCKTGIVQQVGGIAGMVTGGVFLIAGIPMIAIGATPEDPPPARVGVHIGPTGGRFDVTF